MKTNTINLMVDREVAKATKTLELFNKGKRDFEFVLDMVTSSTLPAIWQLIFEDVDDVDFQIDLDNAVRS